MQILQHELLRRQSLPPLTLADTMLVLSAWPRFTLLALSRSDYPSSPHLKGFFLHDHKGDNQQERSKRVVSNKTKVYGDWPHQAELQSCTDGLKRGNVNCFLTLQPCTRNPKEDILAPLQECAGSTKDPQFPAIICASRQWFLGQGEPPRALPNQRNFASRTRPAPWVYPHKVETRKCELWRVVTGLW